MTTRIFRVLVLLSGCSLAQSAPIGPASSPPQPQTTTVASAQPAAALVTNTFVVRGIIRSGTTPLPGVNVTAANTLTGKKVATATNPDGSFSLVLPSRGRYVIKTDLAAFASTTKEVVITPETPQATVDADLMLSSRAQILAAQQQQAAGAAAQEQIATALANRGMQSLSVTESDASGTTPTSNDTSQQTAGLPLNGAGTDAPTESVSISGAMGQAQNFGMNVDEIQDRIQEMRDRMQREGPGGAGPILFGGEAGGGFGGGPGVFVFGGRAGRFNANQPHGSIFYSTDNSIFDAAPYALNTTGNLPSNAQKASYDQNRYGVTIGSPLKIPHVVNSEKTFVFLNWTGGRNTNPFDEFSTVPTLAERQGDFSATATQLIDPTTGQPIAGNRITNINPAAQTLLQFIPQPNLPGDINNFHFVTSLTQNNDQLAIRLIHNFGEGGMFGPPQRGGGGGGRGRRRARNNINFNLNYSNSTNELGNAFPTLSGTTQTSGINTGFGWMAGANNLHFNYNRSHTRLSNLFQDKQNIAAAAGITGTSQDPFNYGVPSLVFTNFQSLQDIGATLSNNQTFAWSESLFVRRGKHNLRFGGDFRRIYNDTRSSQNARGSFTFTGFATGNDFADFLLGLPQLTSIQGGSTTYGFRQNFWDLFIQDDWRASGNLSFNLGLRYEYISPFSEQNNRIVNLDLNPAISAAVPVLPGGIGPFTGGFPVSLVEPDRNNFAPRIGIAWKATKKIVARGGYGINYNTGQYGSIVQNLANQPPFAFTETNVSSAANFLTLENGFPPAVAAVTNNFAIDKNYKLGYVQIWNLNVQAEVKPSLLVNIGYNGSKGTDLDIQRAPNRLPNGQLRIPGVQPFILETSQGDSILHAGTLQVRKRLRHGISAQGTYVFSKSIDNASTIGGGAVVVAQNDLDLAAERSLSSFDQRHKFTGNFLYELPFGTGKKWLNNNGGWLENVLGDWQWSGNFSVASGFPFTPRVLGNFTDVSQGVNGTLRANIVGDPYSGTCPNGFPVGTIECWFNTSAFAIPGTGQFGDARRNSIIGPGQFTFGMSVSKTLLAKDTRALELRIAANNVLNHPVFSSIGTVLDSRNYGEVISAGSMRTVTLSARYRF
ncbi:MAG: TonB-dependent receptor [Acidobacteria bacterium]|nr:TonB-dependent receptor [Acidobacteriota bacterium]